MNLRITSTMRRITDAVRSVTSPAALVQAHQEQQPVVETAADPADVYTADEMPAIADIEDAADGYAAASDRARAADRSKRKHRKILDRLPAGRYGRWLIERVPSSRKTVDLDEVRRTYARLGLGELPMRTPAPSLRVTAVAADSDPDIDEALRRVRQDKPRAELAEVAA